MIEGTEFRHYKIDSATNAVRDMARIITLHLHLRVLICGVFSSIDRLIGYMKGDEEFDRLFATKTLIPLHIADQPIDRRKDTTY